MEPTSTKSRLLDAATAVFLSQGYAAASMDMIRQEAGVSNGSLYHHFPTKAHLADAVYARWLRQLHGHLFRNLAPQVTAARGVAGLVKDYVHWVVEHPDGARLLHELRRSGGLSASGEWSEANQEGFAALGQWIAHKVEEGEMRALPLPVWLAIVFGPALALTPMWVAQPQPAVPPKVRAALENAAWLGVAP